MEAAFCLKSFMRGDGEDKDGETVGAILLAEHFALIRSFLGPKK